MKDENEDIRKDLVPLGTKKLGVCGRMPGAPKDQIDFTKEGNTIGIINQIGLNIYLQLHANIIFVGQY